MEQMTPPMVISYGAASCVPPGQRRRPATGFGLPCHVSACDRKTATRERLKKARSYVHATKTAIGQVHVNKHITHRVKDRGAAVSSTRTTSPLASCADSRPHQLDWNGDPKPVGPILVLAVVLMVGWRRRPLRIPQLHLRPSRGREGARCPSPTPPSTSPSSMVVTRPLDFAGGYRCFVGARRDLWTSPWTQPWSCEEHGKKTRGHHLFHEMPIKEKDELWMKTKRRAHLQNCQTNTVPHKRDVYL